MKNLSLLIIIVLAMFIHTFATGQEPDVIFYKDKAHDLFSNPLETFYKSEKARPKFSIEPGVTSSGNWRGYVAIWEITKNTLYLKAINSWICGTPLNRPPDQADCQKADIK